MSWPIEAEKILRSTVPVGSRLLVAVSGGPDSVALAHFLRSQPYSLRVAHVNHQLRPESSADARFVERMAKTWDIPCHTARVGVGSYAKRCHLGIEEAARFLRYKALEKIARRTGCQAIVTAHTADDQAETVLMNFLRGAGPSGLGGIPEARALSAGGDLYLVRPFLKAKKSDLSRYARTHSLSSRRDRTNDSLRFTRNRIRHATLPYLERTHPGLSDRLIQIADVFRQEERFWESRVTSEYRKTVRRNGDRFTVVLPKLLGYHKALSRRILRRILPGFSFQDIEAVLSLARSPERAAWLQFPGYWRAKRENDRLVIQKRIG